MGFLTEWLTNIILLILLATILELMLPNSSMQRYVKMVVGLLLLVIMLQPLLSIMREDVDTWLFSLSNDTRQTEQLVANSINSQKREIELGQRAYISEQVAVQLMNQVEEALKDEYALMIVHANVELANDATASVEEQQIKAVHVSVRSKEGEADGKVNEEPGGIQSVEVVHIDTSEKIPAEPMEMSEDLERVQEFLAQYWHIPKETILVAWEGGRRAG